MFENLKKAFDRGVEFAFATEAKVEKAAKDFAAENNLNKEEAKKLLNLWLKKSEEARKTMEKQISDLQKITLAKMNLATKAEIKKLEDRIKKLEGGPKKAAPAKKAKPVAKKAAPKKPVKKAAKKVVKKVVAKAAPKKVVKKAAPKKK